MQETADSSEPAKLVRVTMEWQLLMRIIRGDRSWWDDEQIYILGAVRSIVAGENGGSAQEYLVWTPLDSQGYVERRRKANNDRE
jgi:hypothetical protein